MVQMVKGMRYINNFGEAAPTLLTNPKKASRNPELETIVEDDSESFDVVPKRVLVILPLLLSFVIYFLLYRDLAMRL